MWLCWEGKNNLETVRRGGCEKKMEEVGIYGKWTTTTHGCPGNRQARIKKDGPRKAKFRPRAHPSLAQPRNDDDDP